MGSQLLSPKQKKVEPSNFDHLTGTIQSWNHGKKVEVQSNGAELLMLEEGIK